MELELKQTKYNYYESLPDTQAYAEAGMEMIVPDARPDILRLVETCGEARVQHKEVSDGEAVVSGVIDGSILYIPDDRSGICCLSFHLPFTCTAEGSEFHKGELLAVSCCSATVQANPLNPRKLHIRAGVNMLLCRYYPSQLIISNGVDANQETGIQIRQEMRSFRWITSVKEKNFAFEDAMKLPGSKLSIQDILKASWSIQTEEQKMMGKKLILKGNVRLSVLYQTVERSISTVDFDLPFSQVIDMEPVKESAEAAVMISFTNASLQMDDDRTVLVSVGLSATASVAEEFSISVLSDLYSTQYPLNARLFQPPDPGFGRMQKIQVGSTRND